MSAATPDLWLFFLLVAGVIALPGMDMAFVAGSTLSAGLRGGLAAVAGIVAAGLLHSAVATTGLAALWLAWPALFNALLLAGAAYMGWIGWSLWRAAPAAASAAEPQSPGGIAAAVPPPRRHDGRIFARGALTCLLNPKAYAFMLAVFPAFLGLGQGGGTALAWQAARLAAVIAATQLVVYGGVALAVGAASGWGRRTAAAAASRWALRAVGATLLAGALLTPWLAWRAGG